MKNYRLIMNKRIYGFRFRELAERFLERIIATLGRLLEFGDFNARRGIRL